MLGALRKMEILIPSFKYTTRLKLNNGHPQINIIKTSKVKMVREEETEGAMK
jgi:hypothetical protein